MDKAIKRLCTICARGGSKGVKHKNIRMLRGKPVISYSIEQARASGLFNCIAVSSDSAEILRIASEYGVDYLIPRPDELATDDAAKLPVICHAVVEAERQSGQTYETVVDLDATSPLRLPEDIVSAVALLEGSDAGNVITGAPARRSPYFNLVELNVDGFVHLSKQPSSPVFRRQDAPMCFDMNASIYVWRRQTLLERPTIFNPNTRLHVMPEERSIDIDSELDFRIVELLIANR